MKNFNAWLETLNQMGAKTPTKTYIFWSSDGNKYTYQGVVGGAMWDEFISNAKAGHGICYLIDGESISNAKESIPTAKATSINNVFVYGAGALNAISKFGGKPV